MCACLCVCAHACVYVCVCVCCYLLVLSCVATGTAAVPETHRSTELHILKDEVSGQFILYSIQRELLPTLPLSLSHPFLPLSLPPFLFLSPSLPLSHTHTPLLLRSCWCIDVLSCVLSSPCSVLPVPQMIAHRPLIFLLL